MVTAMLLALQTATASASMTIKWNTNAPAARQRTAPAERVRYGTLVAMNGRTASVRLADGSTATFQANQGDLETLRALIGTRIAFRVSP